MIPCAVDVRLTVFNAFAQRRRKEGKRKGEIKRERGREEGIVGSGGGGVENPPLVYESQTKNARCYGVKVWREGGGRGKRQTYKAVEPRCINYRDGVVVVVGIM